MPKSTQKMFLASIILAGTTSMIAPQAGAKSMAPPSKVLKVQGGAIELRTMTPVEVERELIEIDAVLATIARQVELGEVLVDRFVVGAQITELDVRALQIIAADIVSGLIRARQRSEITWIAVSR